MADQPRRPGQLSAEQVDLIPATVDEEYNAELAHTTAQAVVPLNTVYSEDDPEVSARIIELINEEGIDSVAESWASSPEGTLPGMLWRGYLLREWIRRFPDVVGDRVHAAQHAIAETNNFEDLPEVLSAEEIRDEWDEVFKGHYEGNFSEVLRQSALFTGFLATVEPEWITEDTHPLATEVTRRETAMNLAASEFAQSARLAAHQELA